MAPPSTAIVMRLSRLAASEQAARAAAPHVERHADEDAERRERDRDHRLEVSDRATA